MNIGPYWYRVCAVVLPLCEQYGGSVTSFYRTEKHNAALPGSVQGSRHLTAEALDVKWDNDYPPLEELEAICRPFGIQVVREVAQGHDHFEWEPKLLPPAVVA